MPLNLKYSFQNYFRKIDKIVEVFIINKVDIFVFDIIAIVASLLPPSLT